MPKDVVFSFLSALWLAIWLQAALRAKPELLHQLICALSHLVMFHEHSFLLSDPFVLQYVYTVSELNLLGEGVAAMTFALFDFQQYEQCLAVSGY